MFPDEKYLFATNKTYIFMFSISNSVTKKSTILKLRVSWVDICNNTVFTGLLLVLYLNKLYFRKLSPFLLCVAATSKIMLIWKCDLTRSRLWQFLLHKNPYRSEMLDADPKCGRKKSFRYLH